MPRPATRPDSAIKPIERSTLASVMTERLRELVIQGTFPPGAQMNEVELAERFGVSRGPIREGLQRLVQEGLLRSEPHRGAFVPRMDGKDIADIYLAREAIEGAAIRAIQGSGRANAVAGRLRAIVRRMQDAATAGRWARVAELDMSFHTELVQAAGSQRLSRLYGSLINETRVLLALTASYPGREDLVAEHLLLADLLEAGDLPTALEALASHFAKSRDVLGDRLARRS